MGDIFINENLRRLKWLVEECPLGYAERQCPLKALREAKGNALVEVIEAIPATEISRLLNTHHRCFKKRQARKAIDGYRYLQNGELPLLS